MTGKDKGHSITGHEHQDGEERCSSTLSLTSALDGVGSTPAPAALAPGNDSVLIVQKAGWAPGPVWTDAENLAFYRDSTPGPRTENFEQNVNHVLVLLSVSSNATNFEF